MCAAIIEMDVGLTAKSKSEIDTYLEKTDKIKENLKTIRSFDDEIEKVIDPAKESTRPEFEDAEDTVERLVKEILKEEEKKEEKTQQKKFKEAKLDKDAEKLFTDPKGFITEQVRGELEKQFEDVLEAIPVVALVILAAKVAQYVLDEFVKKGGPFNRDFRRFLQQEIDVGLSREQVKRRDLGIDQVIISQTRGWVPHNTNWTWNSLYHVNQSRISRIAMDDRAEGLVG